MHPQNFVSRRQTSGSAGGWSYFFSDWWRRTRSPFSNPVFFLYFVIVVVGVAGAGTFVTLYRCLQLTPANQRAAAWLGVYESGVTYAIAISATALADVIVSTKVARGFQLVSLLLTALVAFALAQVFLSLPAHNPWSWFALATVIALYQWWLTNSDNPALEDDKVDPTSLTGGNPMTDLAGDTRGWDL